MEPEPGTILAVGTDVGVAARLLAPFGMLVEEGPERHAEAIDRTRELIVDPNVSSIFEAAFAFDRVLVRADILERLASGGWRLAEVKSTTRVKPEHLHDLAIQTYVIAGCGLTIEEMQLIHVNRSYIRGDSGIDWQAYFEREDVTGEVGELLAAVPERVAAMHVILGTPTVPEVRPSGHCFSPYECEFWKRCTADKPADWIIYLPRLKAARFAELEAYGVESMRDIPLDFPLTSGQQRVVNAMISGREFISDELRDALIPLEPPASYLDFETFSPAIPLYEGTRPYQRIPFQWSLDYAEAPRPSNEKIPISHETSKWFGRFFDKIKVNRVFHELRHTWIEEARHSTVDRDIWEILSGHSARTVSDRYGGKKPDVLAEANETVCKFLTGNPEIMTAINHLVKP